MEDVREFFDKKRSWSKYKDMILDYYLQPYLNKVATLGEPIVVIDCFAGPGKFNDGEPGSPFIISNNLESLHKRGIDVKGYYVENDPDLYQQLKDNCETVNVPTITREGNFIDHIDEIEKIAKKNTVFVYLDPIKPSDLKFDDLKSAYHQLKLGKSVETLINFMSTGFLRGIWGSKGYAIVDNVLQKEHKQVKEWDQIAGGKYWHDLALDKKITQSDRMDKLAEGYADNLKKWFNWVLSYPIREKYSDEFPKYHLIFGSRSYHAVDLMNRAMVNARRKFVGAFSIEGMLFDNQPEKEVVEQKEIKNIVLKTSRKTGKTSWKMLRVRATITVPCKYTDSEFNKAIKKAIKDGELGSTCEGNKIQEDEDVWPV